MGKAAVELALAGKNAVMPAIVRTSDKPYRWKIGACRSTTSRTSRRRCRATSSPPTASASPRSAARYLAPLIAGEDYPPFKNGLPDYVRLKNVAVPKKLETEFKV